MKSKNLKIQKYIGFLPLFLFVVPFLSGCSSSSDTDSTIYLKVLNAGDYVYLNDPDEGYEDPDLTDQFVEWINEDENKEKYFGKDFNKNIDIIYDTYDTNETMYNELKTGKTTYDLVCSSDYMIQKMAKANMVKKIDQSRVENYVQYCSKFLRGNTGKLGLVNIDPNNLSLGTLDDYTVGYMWGTLGMQYNPTFYKIKNRTPEEVIDDFSQPDSWNVLWDKKEYYLNCASIKDSMRDTYAMGIAHAYNDEFAALYEEYAGNYNEEYTAKLSDIFNRHDDEDIAKVQEALIELKNNIFGFEVDTGKSDIVTQKVGINLCWSGDAVYSMDTAEEEEDFKLYFSIPSYICNLWMDGFTLMSNSEGEHESAAYAFLDFISQPYVASENMDYVGYTSFIGGDEVFETIQDWYDVSEEDEEGNITNLDDVIEYDLGYFFNNDDDPEADYVIYAEPEQINRQLRAQYPLESDLPHLAIMQDFGTEQNDKIVSMWEKVKVNPLPVWVTVIVIASFVLLLGYLGSTQLIRKIKIKQRKKYRE